MAIMRDVSRNDHIGIAGHRRCDLHSIFKIAHAHRQRLPHALSVAAGDASESQQVGNKLSPLCIASGNAKDVIDVRDRMPGDERAAWCLLAPFDDRTALINKSFTIERDVQKNVGIEENLQQL